MFSSGSTLPPNTAVEGYDAQGENKETQRHGLPPPESINGPQCHQQSLNSETNLCL